MSRTYHHGKWNWQKKEESPTKRLMRSVSHGGKYYGMMNEPKAWRKVYKHRKRRASLSNTLHMLKNGYDPDGLVWPLDSKPWIYYW